MNDRSLIRWLILAVVVLDDGCRLRVRNATVRFTALSALGRTPRTRVQRRTPRLEITANRPATLLIPQVRDHHEAASYYHFGPQCGPIKSFIIRFNFCFTSMILGASRE
ncbi:MAG TPA: hypothetical protein PJ991_10340 [Kiritimatiellia bacterium]|nr:hypothetical protein [Kiritimatiellia bacterium]